MEQLAAIDLVRERMHVGYEDARTALETTGWNELEAIILLEKESQKENIIWTKGSDWLDKLKELIHKGNVTRIKIKQGEKVLAEFPATVGVVGAAMAPYLALIGGVVALVGRCQIEVERENGKATDHRNSEESSLN